MNASERDRQVVRVSAAILVANILVAAGKLIYGTALGSIAIRADGFHSLLDGINNVVIIVAMSVAGRPADDDHPYGHRKFEVLASLGIGALFAVLIYRTATDAFLALDAPPRTLSSDAYAVVLVTLVINITVAAVEHVLGRRLRSDLLIADARHTISDVFVSLTVLAGVVLNRRGVPAADALSALVVVLVIAWVGYGVVRQAIAGLADEVGVPPEELSATAASVAGVRAVSRVRSRQYGGEIKIDVVITVDGAISVAEAHTIADAVEAAIEQRWAHASDVVVHVEPA